MLEKRMIFRYLFKYLVFFGFIFLLSGCVNNLPPSALRYIPNEEGKLPVAKKLKVIVTPFEEGDDFEGKNPYSIKGHEPLIANEGVQALYNGTRYSVEPLPIRLSKWLATELAASGYFESVKYVSWEEASELYKDVDILVSGKINKFTVGVPSFFWMLPPQSILVLVGGAIGIPTFCYDQELNVDIFFANPREPYKQLGTKNISLYDDLCISMWSKEGQAPLIQTFTKRQREFFKKAFLEFRENMVKEIEGR